MTKIEFLPADLQKRVHKLVEDHPPALEVVQLLLAWMGSTITTNSNGINVGINRNICIGSSLEINSNSNMDIEHKNTHSPQKKRKLQIENIQSQHANPITSISSVSLMAPIRKKVVVTLAETGILMHLPNEMENTLADIRFSDIAAVLLLQTPEKVKPHTTVVIVHKLDVPGIQKSAILFCSEDQTLTFETISPNNIAKKQSLSRFTEDLVKLAKNTPLPTFCPYYPSKIPGNIASVGCHYKSKPGNIFFFSTCILFGVASKPIIYIPLPYTMGIRGVTGRTFDLVIEFGVVNSEDGLFESEIEFGMLDSKHYSSIATYCETLQKMQKRTNGADAGENDDGDVFAGDVLAGVESDSDDEDFSAVSGSDVDEEYNSDTQSVGSVSIHSEVVSSDGDDPNRDQEKEFDRDDDDDRDIEEDDDILAYEESAIDNVANTRKVVNKQNGGRVSNHDNVGNFC